MRLPLKALEAVLVQSSAAMREDKDVRGTPSAEPKEAKRGAQ
jgi:hypothetical protein